ncbi:MAG: sugar transferase [Spirosomataceae bacterium]
MYCKFIKPSFDSLFALTLLILVSPIILISALILWIDLGEIPFFKQKRPGLNEKIFEIIKLKTMYSLDRVKKPIVTEGDRVSKIGGIIRKLSIDELPQLINILKGEMSFIGPRPLIIDYLELYSTDQKRRHSVKPGISGWAQVNGRNQISWKEKFDLDLYYVDHLSFTLDIKILILTIKKVIKQEGVNQNSNVPMEPFNGKN